MNKNKMINFIVFDMAFLSFIFLYFNIKKLGLIPDKYVGIFIIIESLILIGGFILGRLKKYIFNIISIILFIIIIIANSFGYYYVKHFDQFIDKGFTGDIINKTKFYLITSSSNTISNIDDITLDQTIYYYVNNRNIDIAKEKLGEYEYSPIEDLNIYLADNKTTNNYLLVSTTTFNACIELNIDLTEEDYKILYDFDIETVEKRNEEEKEVYNILILGKDFSDLRDDFNMIVTVNTKTKKVLFTSMPRDSYMPVAGTNYKDSLTFMFEYGEDVQMESIGNFFNTTIDYKFVLYAENLVDVVDEIGGIEFCSDRAFTTKHTQVLDYNDKVGKKVYIRKGCQELNGIETLTVARERVAFNPEGDRKRQENCRKILISILEKIASVSTLSNYSSVLDSLSGLYKTTMNRNTAVRLIRSALQNEYEILEQSINGKEYRVPMGPTNWYGNALIPYQSDVENASNKIAQILNEE